MDWLSMFIVCVPFLCAGALAISAIRGMHRDKYPEPGCPKCAAALDEDGHCWYCEAEERRAHTNG